MTGRQAVLLLCFAIVGCGGQSGNGDGGAMDAGPVDAARSDAGADSGSPIDAQSVDDATVDATVVDATVESDAGADSGAVADAGGMCSGDVGRHCDVAEDCAPVACHCHCSGCGGFSFEDIVNVACVDAYYSQHGCAPAEVCPGVCCEPTTITCIDHVCGATVGTPA